MFDIPEPTPSTTIFYCLECGCRAKRMVASMDPDRQIGDCLSGIKAHAHRLVTADFDEAVANVANRAYNNAQTRVRQAERVSAALAHS
jgi:hypothetical protein